MTSNAVSIIPRESGGLLPLEPLDVVVLQIQALVDADAADLLDEARRQAEAHALYEKRAQNKEREEHFRTLKLLAEAGLGSLSYDKPEIIQSGTLRYQCRVLASAFERGDLVALCRDADQANRPVFGLIQERGYTYAPGEYVEKSGSITWRNARAAALEIGKPLFEIPPDLDHAQQVEIEANERYLQRRKEREAWDRLERIEEQKVVATGAANHSPNMDVAYGLLRETIQAVYNTQVGMNRRQREDLDYILSALYEAVHAFGGYLEDHPRLYGLQ